MRTTVRIDDSLIREMKRMAAKEGVSLTQLFERAVRLGLRAMRGEAQSAREFCQKTYDMGEPRIPLDKALSIAFAMDDEEFVRKMQARDEAS